jgi:hypothetical protein
MDAILDYMYYMTSALRKLPDFIGYVYRGNNNPELVSKEYYQGREIYW